MSEVRAESTAGGVDQEKSTTTPARDATVYGREAPQARITKTGSGNLVELPFVHDDGWSTTTVGWHDDQYRGANGAMSGTWFAECSHHPGIMADSPVSQLHALAELVRCYAGLVHIFERREVELHRTIYNSPDTLARELRDAERALHDVQRYITTHVKPGPTNWDDGLKPLWRAENALKAFAARIATPIEGARRE